MRHNGGISSLVLFLDPEAPFLNLRAHARNLWLAQRTAKYNYHSFMLLDLLDSHVLLWLQTLSGVNGLWAMTMQELAAADIASVHCKPNWLHKTKKKMEAVSNIFSWDRNQSLHSNGAVKVAPHTQEKEEKKMWWFCCFFFFTTINLFFPSFFNTYLWDSWGNHVVKKSEKKHDTVCSRVVRTTSQ